MYKILNTIKNAFDFSLNVENKEFIKVLREKNSIRNDKTLYVNNELKIHIIYILIT